MAPCYRGGRLRIARRYAKREDQDRDSNHFNPEDERLLCESGDLILDFIAGVDAGGVHSVKVLLIFAIFYEWDC